MPLTRPVAAQIKFDVTNINDPLIRLNSDESGSADKDTGLVFERGSDQNVALIYDESADTFALVNTDETGTTSGNVTIASYADLKVNNLQVQGTTTTVNAQTINATNAFVFEGATADDFETTLAIGDPTADRTVTLPDATGTLALTSDIPTAYTSSDFNTAFAAKNVSDLSDVEVASTPSDEQALLWNPTYSNWQPGDVATLTGTQTLTNKTMTAPVLNAPVFGTGTNSPYFTEIRYNTSNMMKFNQMYTGAATGSYFDPNEYQKVVTITPASNSENYQIIGRITAQNAGETHIVNFNAALRSGDPLPDLSWTVEYSEEYNGSRYIDPQLWTKETTTAGFIFAFKVLSRIYGTVTVDMDVIPRSSSLLTNVVVNSTQNSEQSSVDTGFTARDMTRVLRRQGTVHTLSGNLLPDTTETYDIGSTTQRFNDIFLAGSTVDIGGTKISKDDNGDIDIKDSSDVRKTIKAAAIELFDADGKKIKIERDASSGKMKTKKYDSSGNEESSQDVIDISEDQSPKLGGDLDVNDNSIISSGNGNIVITPNGSGNILLDGMTFPNADGSSGQVLQTNGSGTLSFVDQSSGGGYTASASAPSSPSDGDEWWDTDNATFYKYINDGTTSQWVEWSPGTDGTDATLDGSTSISGDILPDTDNVHDLGSSSKRFVEIHAVTLQGTSTSAQYADLAEMYAGDKNYEVGTVVCVGGDKEVTECTAYADSKIAGVVSDKPAYLMNRDIDAEHPVCVGFVGRVPIKVVGHIEKGDLLTSSEIKGYATKFSGDYHPGCIIGLALNNKEDGIDTVEVLLKRS